MIILYFDDRYFKWAPPLIESIAINEPTEKIMVFGLNLLPSQKKKILSFSNVKSLVEMKEASFKAEEGNFSKKNRDEIASLLVGKKAWYIKRAFKIFPKESLYILLDVDMLLLRPLMSLKKQMKNYDMAGASNIEIEKIAGGFLAFRPTKIIRRLMREWDEFLTSGTYYWDKDQPSLTRLYRKYKKLIRLLVVPREQYLDARSRKNSILWSAHKSVYGLKERRYMAYLKKLQKMRKERL